MRWFVEVSRVGQEAEVEKYCLDAKQWQAALQEVRKRRGDAGPLSKFSIELLDEGYRAVDSKQKLRYVVAKAPLDAPLIEPRVVEPPPNTLPLASAAPLSEPAATDPMIAPPSSDIPSTEPMLITPAEPPPKAPEPEPARKPSRPVLRVPDDEVPRPSAAPAASSDAPVTSAPEATRSPPIEPKPEPKPAPQPEPPQSPFERAASGAQPRPSTHPTQRSLQAATAPAHQVLRKREDEPTEQAPMLYREYAYAVEPGTTVSAAKLLLWEQYAELTRAIRERTERKYIQLAVFDHVFERRPERAPLATLIWKDWRGDPLVTTSEPSSARSSVQPAAPAPAPAASAPAASAPAASAPAASAPAASEPAAAPSVPPRPDWQPPASPSVAPLTAARPSSRPPPPAPSEAPASGPADGPPSGPPSVDFGPAEPVSLPPSELPPEEPPPPAQEPAPPAEEPAPVSEGPSVEVGPAEPVSIPPSELGAAEAPRTKRSERPPAGLPSEPPPPSSRALQRGKRRADEDLIGELFESMHELHFMPDMVSGVEFVLGVIQKMLPSDAVIVHVFDINSRDFIVVRALGAQPEQLILHRTADTHPFLVRAMRRSRTTLVGAPDEAYLGSRWDKLGNVPTAAAFGPVQIGGRYLGAIELANPSGGGGYSENEAHALDYICEQFAEFLAARPVVLDAEVVLPKG